MSQVAFDPKQFAGAKISVGTILGAPEFHAPSGKWRALVITWDSELILVELKITVLGKVG